MRSKEAQQKEKTCPLKPTRLEYARTVVKAARAMTPRTYDDVVREAALEGMDLRFRAPMPKDDLIELGRRLLVKTLENMVTNPFSMDAVAAAIKKAAKEGTDIRPTKDMTYEQIEYFFAKTGEEAQSWRGKKQFDESMAALNNLLRETEDAVRKSHKSTKTP